MKCYRCGDDLDSPADGCGNKDCPFHQQDEMQSSHLCVDDGDPHFIPYREAFLSLMVHHAAILNIGEGY